MYPLIRIDPASDRLTGWSDLAQLGFKELGELPQEYRTARAADYAGHRITAAVDGETIIGTFRSWDLDLTVPGGTLLADAVSAVTVRPTHRRRGVMSAMITADLAAAAERGVAVAVLIAAESTIYGRFGYGPATEAVTWTVDVRAAQLHPAAAELAATVGVDIVADAELRTAGPAVYAEARRPGEIDRSELWWDITCGIIAPPFQHGSGAAGTAVNVLARDAAGRPVGVLRYTPRQEWQERAIRTRVEVQLLHAATSAGEAALWDYLVNLDLVATVRVNDRSVEDGIGWLLRDTRAARQSGRCDFLWTRVVDPVATLTARRYLPGGHVVLEVVDEDGYATGRFALEVDAAGHAECAPTAAPPDARLPAATLGAVWLGGHDLAAMGRAGLAVEQREGGLERAATLFRTATPPWSSTWF